MDRGLVAAAVGVGAALVAFAPSIHAQATHATSAHRTSPAHLTTVGAPLPAGWAWPGNPAPGARRLSANTVYRPVNVAALRAVPKTRRCVPIEVAPGVWITPLCNPLPRLAASAKALPLPVRVRTAAAPQSVDLKERGLDGPIKDQQQAGVCWSFAISTLLDNAVRRAGRADVFAPLHIIAHDEWDLLFSYGAGKPIVGEASWPYDPVKACELDEHLGNEHYCMDAYNVRGGSWRGDPETVAQRTKAEAAGDFKIIAMHRLEHRPGNPNQIVDVLASGQAIFATVELNMAAWANAGHLPGSVIPDWQPDGVGGHAVAITGYRTVDGARQFMLHNSWGMSWGDNGYAWITERMMRERLDDAFIVTVGDRAGNALTGVASTLTLGAEDSGKSFVVRKGQDVVLSLSSHTGTGLAWSVTHDGGFGAPRTGFVSDGGDPDVAGGSGTRTWTWTVPVAATSGEHALELEARRGWESGPAAKTYRVTLRVE